jgi:predicted kinase
MNTLTITKGLPASGKSTWAKKTVLEDSGNTKRVNKDELRNMIDAGKWSKANEQQIILLERMLTEYLLVQGYNVIVDNTHLTNDHEEYYRNLAVKTSSTFQIQDFSFVPLLVCLTRNQMRPSSVRVKPSVIIGMYNNYIKNENENLATLKDYIADIHKMTYLIYETKKPNPKLPYCIIVDIDGTLAHMNDRGPYDYSKVQTDKLDISVAEIVQRYYQRNINEENPDTTVIVVSGRKDSCYNETVEWLKNNGVQYDKIYMRKHNDDRDDRIVKQEIFYENIEPYYNVRFVLDDRDRVVAMWRREKLKTLQVGPGDF